MTAIICKEIERTYKNNGQHAQQMLDFTLTGQVRKADNVGWRYGSDIPELNMSVKSDRFSLGLGLDGETLEAKVAYFFANCASTSFAYVATTGTAYIMNADEFYAFLMNFCRLDRASSKNGGGLRVCLGHETRAVRAWLETKVGA